MNTKSLIFELFKTNNNFKKGLKIIVASLKASAGVLRLLVFFVVVAMIIFSALIFYIEKLTASNMSSAISQTGKGSENELTSIIETFWFSIASLTTVGFGDYSPRTPLGELRILLRQMNTLINTTYFERNDFWSHVYSRRSIND